MTHAGDLPRHDLVLVGYVLGELAPAARDRAVDAAWSAAGGALVIIEPGSADGTRRILDARARLLDHGAALVAPCPHAAPCPLADGDWCHFGVRLNRSSLHRRLKRAALAYEDEKYAYVIVAREPVGLVAGRVIRRPDVRTGRVLLHVCCAERGVSVRTDHPARTGPTIAWRDRGVGETRGRRSRRPLALVAQHQRGHVVGL